MATTIRTKPFTIDRPAYLKAIWTRGLARRYATVAAAYAVLLALLTYLRGPAAFWTAAPILLGTMAFSVAVRYGYARRCVDDAAGRQAFDDPRAVEFSETGLYTASEGGAESRIPWSHFVSTERRGGFTFLFTSRIIHFIVPDDAFASPADREALEDLLRRRGLATKERRDR